MLFQVFFGFPLDRARSMLWIRPPLPHHKSLNDTTCGVVVFKEEVATRHTAPHDYRSVAQFSSIASEGELCLNSAILKPKSLRFSPRTMLANRCACVFLVLHERTEFKLSADNDKGGRWCRVFSFAIIDSRLKLFVKYKNISVRRRWWWRRRSGRSKRGATAPNTTHTFNWC